MAITSASSSAESSPASTLSNDTVPAPSENVPILNQISMADILKTQDAYKNVVKSANEYRKAMQAVSKFATQFGDALSQFATLCETTEIKDASLASIHKYAAMQYTFASGNNTLCDLFESQFETPLNFNYQNHKQTVQHNTALYKGAKDQYAQLVKVLEKEKSKATNKESAQFQDSVREMTKQATNCEKIKNHHFDQVVAEEMRNVRFMAARCANWLALENKVLWDQLAGCSEDKLGGVVFRPLMDHDLFLNHNLVE